MSGKALVDLMHRQTAAGLRRPDPGMRFCGPLPGLLRQPIERALGADFSQVRVHADETAARETRARGALAFARGEHIHFAAGHYLPEHPHGRWLVAHELVHVQQQRLHGPLAPPEAAEREARHLAAAALRGEAATVRMAGGTVQCQDSPHDRALVARSRRRLSLLETFEAEWQAREIRRMRHRREATARIGQRRALDQAAVESGADIMTPEMRESAELANFESMNRAPLTIAVDEDSARFTVRFHARFEDPAMRGRLGELQTALQQGLDLVWNQRLTGDVFGGRRLIVTPQLQEVATDAVRDHSHWLITVRASDTAPITHPGCSLPGNDSGVPTSVTDAQCDGGVMSIPPRHVAMGGVLAHELMHLLGLVDRYMNLVSIRPDGTRINENHPTRETPGRLDPLGTEDGPVLHEDLAFLFEHLGVYEMEDSRALDTLSRLEAQGLSIGAVRREMMRLREIIELGHDPLSLIRPRADFTRELMRSAEDL